MHNEPMKLSSCSYITRGPFCENDFLSVIADMIDEARLSDFFEALLAGMMIGSCTRNPHLRNFVVCLYLFVLLTVPSISGESLFKRSASPFRAASKSFRKTAGRFSDSFEQNENPTSAAYAGFDGLLRLRGCGPKQQKSGGKKGPAKGSKPAPAATAGTPSAGSHNRPNSHVLNSASAGAGNFPLPSMPFKVPVRRVSSEARCRERTRSEGAWKRSRSNGSGRRAHQTQQKCTMNATEITNNNQ